MCEGFNHGGEEHDDIFLLEWLFSGGQIGFEVGDAFFHLNIPFFAGVDVSSLLLQNVATLVFNDIRVRVMLNF